MNVELTVQCGGWPREHVVWVSAEAGANPPPRDWRSPALDDAVRLALVGLGADTATVVQAPDADDPGFDEREDVQLGTFRLAGGSQA